MIGRTLAAAAAALTLAAGPAPAAPGPCEAPPKTVAEGPRPLYESILGRPTLRHIPKSPRGIIYLFHGSGGSEAFAARLHTRRVLAPLIAAGFGFVAAPSLDRTDVRRWRLDSLDPAVNPDVNYMLSLHREMVRRGEIGDATPVFTMGMSNGGGFANLFAAAAKAQGLPVTAVANYMGPFPAAMRGAESVAPTLVVVGQTDGLVAADAVAQVASELRRKGAQIEVHLVAERRVCASDLALVADLTPAMAEALIRERMPAWGVLDANGARQVFLEDPLIDRADMAALGRMLAPAGASARDVMNELLIAWGAHQMRSDFADRQLAFFQAALGDRSLAAGPPLARR